MKKNHIKSKSTKNKTSSKIQYASKKQALKVAKKGLKEFKETIISLAKR